MSFSPSTYLKTHRSSSRIGGFPAICAWACVGAGLALSLSCTAPLSPDAYGVTAAEKQAEADAVFAQIDSLQTNLNKAMGEYEAAKQSYDSACASRDEASQKIEEQTERIETLQSDLSNFAVGMYKRGGAGTFLDVVLDATTFEQFLTSWDACNSIAVQGTSLLDESRKARSDLERAEARYQKQSERAEADMKKAESAKAEIEETQAALREEAEKLSAEAAELQLQEELAAEAARQAEEARKQREAELEAAAKAAEEAQAQAQAEQQAGGESDEQQGDGNWQDASDDSDDAWESSGEGEAEAAYEYQAPVLGPGYFTNPCPGATSSSGFGYRTFDNSFHKGLDMAASEGTPYYAADSGTVMFATNDGGYNGGAGNWVVISHGNGVVTKYMHSSATYVTPGQYVSRGENIGAVGNTGNSFGAHLHFQVEIDGVAVNPLNYL